MAAPRKKSDPAPLVGAGLGRIAFDAYSEVVGGKRPAWDDIAAADPNTVAAAWCAAAQAVITATIARKD